MSCDKGCLELRAAFVDAVIARDVRRAAGTLADAAKVVGSQIADLVVATVEDDQPPPRKRRGK